VPSIALKMLHSLFHLILIVALRKKELILYHC
jgi:hypothetical protein